MSAKSKRSNTKTKRTRKGRASKKDIDLSDESIDSIFSEYKQMRKKEKKAPSVLCPNCNRDTLSDYHGKGILLCSNPNCAIELENVIDCSPGNRYLSADDNKHNDTNRCGLPINDLLPQYSYGTKISFTPGCPYDRKMNRINFWYLAPHPERSLKKSFDKITGYGNVGNIPSAVVNFAHKLYHEIYTKQIRKDNDNKINRGGVKNGLEVACLHFACRLYEIPRSIEEMEKMTGVLSSDINKGINIFKELTEDSELINVSKSKYLITYKDFLERFCNQLGLSNDFYNELKCLGEKVAKKNILSKNTPQAIACGLVFFWAHVKGKKNITKNMIAEKCGAGSIPTITSIFEILSRHTMELI